MGWFDWFRAKPTPPAPRPPPVLARNPMHVVVRDERGAYVEHIVGEMYAADGSWIVQGVPLSYYMLEFVAPVGVQYGSQIVLKIGADGCDTLKTSAPLEPDANVYLFLTKPKSVFLEPLQRRGNFYYRGGQPFTILESSDFRLYERFLNGEDVEPVLQDRAGMGFNTLRVWLLNTSVGHILPSEHPDFYARLPEFLGLCGRFGLYVEFTVFTQTKTLLPALADQQAHYDRTVAALGNIFCFVEGVNEADQHDNAFDPTVNLHKPPGATFDLCRGSNGSDAWAVEPVIDSARYHSNDANEWWRRAAHNAMEIADHFHVPAWPNENTRPDKDPNPNHHYDAAAGAAILEGGYCHHDTPGKDSVVRVGLDRVCAQAAADGARSVDLSQRTLPYVRRDDLLGPGLIRVYQRGTQIVKIRA